MVCPPIDLTIHGHLAILAVWKTRINDRREFLMNKEKLIERLNEDLAGELGASFSI
jgi:hypothetical protein